MKRLFLAVFTTFFFAHVGLSNTYVWEDYDDFSGSSLDTSKWDVGYFSGGQAASSNGGVATLSGSGYTGSDLENVPSIWQAAAAQSTGQSNSGIFVKETDIYGIEVEVTIPSSNFQNVGFIVETHPADGSTYNGIELAWRESGLFWSFDNENPSTSEVFERTQVATFDQKYTLAVVHTGSRMELHIDGTRVANFNSTFTPNHWLIGSFNDDGKTFNVTIDNVRVLRRSTSEALDGTTLFLDSDDPVTLTLAFENGTFTSTFEDGGEDSGTETGIPYDYMIVDQNRFSITETSQLDGSYITFDQSTGRGKLFDFQSDGQIDESGTWEFSFTSLQSDLRVKPRSIWASRDLVYLQTPSGPTVINGAGEIAFELELFDQPNITNLSLTIDGQTYSLSSDQKPSGFSLEYGYNDPSKPKELFDLESASDSDWTAYENQTTFAFSLTVDGAEYSYSHNLPAESELPPHANVSVAGDHTWKKDTDGYDYVEILKRDSYQFSWDTFSSTDSKDYIVVHLQELVGDDDVQIMPEVVLNAGETSYTVDGSYFEAGKKYAFYVELMNVTEQQNPSGFIHAEGTDTSQPLLQTTARMVTALDLVVIEENVIISDPTGLPVVVQVGEDYHWNDTLDGVMLWGVWQDDDTNDWVIATVNYIGGRQKGAKGSYSALPAELDVDHPYTINGDTIDVTEINGHQYYQVTSVEGDIIFAVDGDDFPLTDLSWWFVEKSSAELFYNTKLGNAPSALTGLRISINDELLSPVFLDFPSVEKYFTDQHIYGYESGGEWKSFPYEYQKLGSDQAELTIKISEESEKTYSLTFASTTQASGNWTSSDDNSSGSTEFTILPESFSPGTLDQLYYKSGSDSENIYFNNSSEATIHFPFYPDQNGSFSPLTQNITYSYEVWGTSIAKLSTSLGDDTWLFFSSNTNGYFDLEGDDYHGTFSLNSAEVEYSTGYAKDEITGDVISIGATQYLFHSDKTATVYHEDGSTSTSYYTFFRTDDNKAILKINGESLEMNLKFLDLDYGRITDGGSGYFQYSENYATKGWVWYDKLPLIYSNNQGAWMYQHLSVNGTSGDSELRYLEQWSGAWKLSNDLNYTDQRVFTRSTDYWEIYDDFNGQELNASKWDVAWWDGGTSPRIEEGSGQIIFNKGTDVGARLSSKMKTINGNAEAKYDRDLSSENGFAPDSIVGLEILIHDIETLPDTDDYGQESHVFSDNLLTRYDWDEQKDVQETYTYQKTGPSEAQLRVESPGQVYTAELTFSSPADASGTWSENEDGETFSGTTSHKLIYQPHSLLEITDPSEIHGIEFEFMIPAGAPNATCIGLYAIDYDKMFNATSEEEEMRAIKFDLDLCYFGDTKMEYYYYDPITYEEQKNERQVTLGQYNKAAFMYEGDNIIFYFNDETIAEYPLTKGNEMYVFRAMNEQNLNFSAYLRNVRVFRKKSYPKGWMWTDYYPWAYSHETGNWIYFELAKDNLGDPVMNYWDTETKKWDIYEPALNPYSDSDL